MSNHMSKNQNFLFVCSAILAVLVSIVITLYLTDNLKLQFGSEPEGYQNITFTDASAACENATRTEFGKRLKGLLIDNHSSRYEHSSYAFKIFLQADAMNKEKKTALHFVNCYVNASNGRISTFEVFENKDAPKSAVSSEPQKLFNWPR